MGSAALQMRCGCDEVTVKRWKSGISPVQHITAQHTLSALQVTCSLASAPLLGPRFEIGCGSAVGQLHQQPPMRARRMNPQTGDQHTHSWLGLQISKRPGAGQNASHKRSSTTLVWRHVPILFPHRDVRSSHQPSGEKWLVPWHWYRLMNGKGCCCYDVPLGWLVSSASSASTTSMSSG